MSLNLRSLRSLRRKRVRQWDSVHNSYRACHDGLVWPQRAIKPCPEYNAWCSDCNAVRFRAEHGRFPRGIMEFYAFETKVQS